MEKLRSHHAWFKVLFFKAATKYRGSDDFGVWQWSSRHLFGPCFGPTAKTRATYWCFIWSRCLCDDSGDWRYLPFQTFQVDGKAFFTRCHFLFSRWILGFLHFLQVKFSCSPDQILRPKRLLSPCSTFNQVNDFLKCFDKPLGKLILKVLSRLKQHY